LFIASIILLGLDKAEILLLSTFGVIAKPLTILLCVISGALSFTAIVALLADLFVAKRKQALLQKRREIKLREQEQEAEKMRQRSIDRIEHLSSRELGYLANCLREKSQSFLTYIHSPPVTLLISKGLAYTPGGAHHQDHYPYIIHDFVWHYLLENKEQILEKDDENRRVEEENERKPRRRY
jgi:hypothetical protein